MIIKLQFQVALLILGLEDLANLLYNNKKIEYLSVAKNNIDNP